MQIKPFGAWKSPLSAELIGSSTLRLKETRWSNDYLHWIEGRPSEKGREVLMAWRDGTFLELPSPFSARTRVHEYGGGAYAVTGESLVFSNDADACLYTWTPGHAPQRLTEPSRVRFADGEWDSQRRRTFWVVEDHSRQGEPENYLVAVGEDGKITRVAEGHDFFSSPRVSPDGRWLAWLSWDHPNMPWDGTDLWLASLDSDGGLGDIRHLAGGPRESVFQPQWSRDNVLHFVSDPQGWWNLYAWKSDKIVPLCPMAAEFGEPAWNFRFSTYALLDDGGIFCAYHEKGRAKLASLRDGKLSPISDPDEEFTYLAASGTRAAYLSGAGTRPWTVVVRDLESGKREEIRAASKLPVPASYLSSPQPIEFPTERGLTAHALFYPPRNPDFRGPDGEKPPCLVVIHGGPTASVTSVLSPNFQYWTSRGFAVVDVNYGGSTGLGREYRERLRGQWGIVDVEDCVNAVRYLAQEGLVDENRLAIRGGSAGGYTVLRALTMNDVFKAGANYYGVSDLEMLAQDTHKFESQYDASLIGARELYKERSPRYHVDKLKCPLIVFQGLEDKVVPPNQSEIIVDTLRKNGIPVAYLAFEGEQHGFRQAETIKRVHEAELFFYSKIFNFTPAEALPVVRIDNF